MRSNFHTHTYLCKHANGAPVDYARSAADNGMDVLGFSDHAPFPEKDFGYRMEYSELEKYISETDIAKNQFKDKLRIYTGLEIEYIPSCDQYYRFLKDKDNELRMDYLVLGEHYFGSEPEKVKNIAFVDNSSDFIEYAEYIAEALSKPYFAFCAHPDIMFKQHIKPDKNSEKACRIILDAAEKYDSILEFNANGLRRGLQKYPDGIRYPYPYIPFWEELKGSSIRVIIGADSHIPEQVWDASVEEAYRICKEMRLNLINNLF